MKPLLDIAPPDASFQRDVLQSPGGFAWWYTDMIDAHGNGLVLIWSFGLPFLPGYTAAARSGRGELPVDRPSLNVAIVRDHRLVCYVLHEFSPKDAEWEGSQWRFGDNTFATTVTDGVRSLDATLDCPLPGGLRLQGTVRLRGTARVARDTDRSDLRHDWAPMTGPSQTHVDLRAGGERYEFEGHGYFDGNVGREPLDVSGVAAWTWGRVPHPDREVIYYVLWRNLSETPEAIGIEIDSQGQLSRTQLRVSETSFRRARAGLAYPSEIHLMHEDEPWLHVKATTVLDDGPFYLRYFIESEHGAGIGEYCRTDRIDLARHRPLVRMRVQRSDGRNSVWLPLFAGPRDGRVGRLITQFVRRT